MKRRRGNFLQKMTAVLLSAVLIVGMTAGTVPAKVRAEENTEIVESVSENTTEPIEEETVAESETETETVTESETDPATNMEETQPQADKTSVMPMTAQAASNIASGEGWVLDGNKILTIESDTGMTNWISNRETYQSQVQSVVIESGVTSIGMSAFYGCSSLVSIEIPSGVTSIAPLMFYGCSSLASIKIPYGVINIGDNAFTNCESLTSIEIPSSVESIGKEAFYSCHELSNVTMLRKKPPTLGSSVFTYSKCVGENIQGIEVPPDRVNAYKQAWTKWADNIKASPHTHNVELVPAKVANCTSAGNNAYYTCSGCDKWFADENGTKEITDKSGVEIDPTGHTFGEWNVTKPATEQETGSKERSCSVCKYKESTVIPKKGATDSGKIDTEVRTDEKTPVTRIATDTKELEDMLLTEEEKQQVANGIDIEIILDVKDASGSVSREDKKTIEAALNGYTMGQYLDISLYKLIAEKRTDITQTKEKITITIAIPDNMKSTDGKMQRTFAVMRMHDGEVELLTDMDNSTDTVTIATDRFSTYAIVYKDGENENVGNDDINSSSNNKNNDTGNNEKDNEPKTGETTPVEICATIAMIAGFSYLLDLFGNIKGGMTEQEKKEMVASIIAWGRKGGKLRRLAALALIFVILLYYHSIGRQVDVDWKEVYGE